MGSKPYTEYNNRRENGKQWNNLKGKSSIRRVKKKKNPILLFYPQFSIIKRQFKNRMGRKL